MTETRKRAAPNWKDLRSLYVNGDFDLRRLSYEYAIDQAVPLSKAQHLPKLETLQDHARNERWHFAREARQFRAMVQDAVLLRSEEVEQAAEALDGILDAQRVIKEHMILANSLQRLYVQAFHKMSAAIQKIDFDKLAERDPAKFVETLSKFATLVATAADMQRKAIGLPALDSVTVHQSLNLTLQEKMGELQEMTDDDLVRAYLDEIKE